MRHQYDVRLWWHRERAAPTMTRAATAFDLTGCRSLTDFPEGRSLLELPGDLRISALLTAASQIGNTLDTFPETVVASLCRRRLPWTPDDAALMLRVSIHHFDATSVGLAVTGARQVLAERPGHPEVFAALQDTLAELHRVPSYLPRVLELRQRVQALLAEQAPGDLLDLAVIDVHDQWGPHARRAFTQASVGDPAVTSRLLRLLAAARSARPSGSWRRSIDELVSASPLALALLHDLLEPLDRLDLSPAGEDTLALGSLWLVSPANAVILRGAVLACASLDADWVSPLLGFVALRSAASNPTPLSTVALCAPVAVAAIDTLGRRRAAGDSIAAAQLSLLYGEITRRDLLRRVAAALDVPDDDAREHSAEVARLKRREQAWRTRHQHPGRREPRRALGSLARRVIAPGLHEAGFTMNRGMTWYRRGDDHIAAIAFGVDGSNACAEVAVWFAGGSEDLAELEIDDIPAIWHFDVRASVLSDRPEMTWELGLASGGDDGAAQSLLHSVQERALPWLAARALFRPDNDTRSFDGV